MFEGESEIRYVENLHGGYYVYRFTTINPNDGFQEHLGWISRDGYIVFKDETVLHEGELLLIAKKLKDFKENY